MKPNKQLTGSITGVVSSIIEEQGNPTIISIGIANYFRYALSNEGGLGHLLGKNIIVHRTNTETKKSHWTVEQSINYLDGKDQTFRRTEIVNYPKILTQSNHSNLADYY